MNSEKLQRESLFREHSELLGRTVQSNLLLISYDLCQEFFFENQDNNMSNF